MQLGSEYGSLDEEALGIVDSMLLGVYDCVTDGDTFGNHCFKSQCF